MKTCTKCQVCQDESNFYPNSKLKSGRTSQCKTCLNKYNAEYQRNHRRGKHLNKTRCHLEDTVIDDLTTLFELTTKCDFDIDRDINMAIRILLRK